MTMDDVLKLPTFEELIMFKITQEGVYYRLAVDGKPGEILIGTSRLFPDRFYVYNNAAGVPGMPYRYTVKGFLSAQLKALELLGAKK